MVDDRTCLFDRLKARAEPMDICAEHELRAPPATMRLCCLRRADRNKRGLLQELHEFLVDD
jgi:hypothetical protein